MTDFPGAETPTQAMHALGIPHILVSASELRSEARAFIWDNFSPLEIRADAWQDPHIEPDCRIHLYIAGFPCQPFSKCGKQQGLLDEQGRGTAAEVCIHRIHTLKPDNFILENVAAAKIVHEGKFWKTLTQQLKREGYTLDDCILDARHYGTPQTRLRV